MNELNNNIMCVVDLARLEIYKAGISNKSTNIEDL